MNSMDMVTKFQVRKDHWITPVGTFEYHGHAKTACEAADLIPLLATEIQRWLTATDWN